MRLIITKYDEQDHVKSIYRSRVGKSPQWQYKYLHRLQRLAVRHGNDYSSCLKQFRIRIYLRRTSNYIIFHAE